MLPTRAARLGQWIIQESYHLSSITSIEQAVKDPGARKCEGRFGQVAVVAAWTSAPTMLGGQRAPCLQTLACFLSLVGVLGCLPRVGDTQICRSRFSHLALAGEHVTI